MSVFEKLLPGNKTYVVAILGIIYAVSGLLTGNLDQSTAVQLIVTALGLAGLRSALKP